MVDIVTLLQAIYDELKAIVQNETSASTPDDHVGVLNRTKDTQTPFFGFEWTQAPVSRGMGGNVRPLGANTDNNGNVTGADHARDYRLTIDLGVTVDGDEPRQRDEYMNDIQSHFSQFIREPTQLQQDVHRVREAGAIPADVQGGDVGALVTYEIEFPTTDTVSLPTADTIDWDVDADGTDAYPEQY